MTSGPIPRGDLEALFQDVTDEGYWRPIVESEDGSREVIDQAIEQLTRASVAVDKTTQAAFIFPWSGQTDAPAAGEQYATVFLTFTRTLNFGQLLVLDRGLIVKHVTTDFGPTGAEVVATGRRYVLSERVAFLPGEAGPIYALAIAERPGAGYNYPQPGTINQFAQAGTGQANTGSLIDPANNRYVLSTGTGSQLDPSQTLGYVAITLGANAGQYRQVRQYLGGSDPTVILDHYAVFRGAIDSGEFLVGERIYQFATPEGPILAQGTLIAVNDDYIAIDVDYGASMVFVTGGYLTGATSHAIYIPDDTIRNAEMLPGIGNWRFSDWVVDLGVSITNESSPTGGRAAMLDELGYERNVPRTNYEGDDAYRGRVGNPSDVVAPNAVRRAANHVLAPYGLSCCYRQVGKTTRPGPLPGLFFDAGSSRNAHQVPATNYAYDLPVQPEHRNRVLLDLDHFRGWFKVGVPPLNLGNFGCAYDVGPANAYDVGLLKENFFDGYPAGNRAVYMAIWAEVERVRQAGVIWDLYIEDIGCV